MHSSKPKVLHVLAGKPMLQRVVDAAMQLDAEAIHVIYGHGGEQIREALPELPVHWVLQSEQLGTGHAVMQALPSIPKDSWVLVLSADVPLIQPETLQQLVAQCTSGNSPRAPLGLLMAILDNPHGLGRILRDEQGSIQAIVEEKDANLQQREIKEIYTGICCVQASDLQNWLPNLTMQNVQEEYYLTDMIAMAAKEHVPIVGHRVTDVFETHGVNNFEQLQQLERIFQVQQAKRLMISGVRLADAARIDIRGELVCGKDVFIDVNAVFSGRVVIGEGCAIAPNCILTNVELGKNCKIHANSVLDNCKIGDDCHIGPFARLRPGTQLASRCKIGNFVETKNAILGDDTKASHLSYLGDTVIGRDVNIGAGTITCNYDGVNKFQTTIEDGVFVGSDSQLVAPVIIGKNATIGAGTTIRKNVPAGELAISAAKQVIISGWTRPTKKK